MISPIEREILKRLHKSNNEIGNILGFSPLSIKNKVHQILNKLDASNRTQALVIALSSGIIKFEEVQI